MRRENKERLSRTTASGMVALVFLILGFQLAVFVIKVVERPRSTSPAEDLPPASSLSPPAASVLSAADEVSSMERSLPAPAVASSSSASGRSKFGGYARPDGKKGTGRQPAGRTSESFRFDPNTVSVGELQRLGLSLKQAQSIENYREKGGRFRTKADFGKIYVVSDTLFERLEPYIEIPLLELNGADSAALVSLRGIGPWYARRIIEYRERLGGFYAKEQLLEIEGMDAERYSGFADGVTVDASLCRRVELWSAPDSSLARHPYIGAKGARSLIRFRQLYDSSHWNIQKLEKERVLSLENIEKLKNYIEIR